MKKLKLEGSPIVYFISERTHAQWILFLHAAFADHTMFQRQVNYFYRQYNVLTLDIVGHGDSNPVRMGDGVDKMSGWIREILQKEQIENVHLVGISLGAVLAQDFANRYPEKLLSLACFGGYDINRFDRRLQQENGIAQFGMMLKAFLSIKWFAKSNKRISAYTLQAQKEFYQMNLRFPKKSFRCLASLNKMINARDPIPRDYPLLIGCGQYDIPAEHTAIELWKKNEPDCAVAILQGAGHCVNMDAPELFHKTLEQFWNCEPHPAS